MKAIRVLVLMALMLLGSMTVLSQENPATQRWFPGRNPRPALTAPPLVAPGNGAVLSPNPTLSWSAVPGAARYHLQVNNIPIFEGTYNKIENWGLSGTSYTIMGYPEAYFPRLYWRVQAIDANGRQGPWSEVREFTISR